MATQQEVIKNFMKSLDTTSKSGVSAADEAIKVCSNSKFSTVQEVINKMVSDCKNASSADSFLKDYCGIVLDNDDTGAITGSDVGGSKTKTAESIVPESGSLKNFTGNSFSTGGLNFQLSYVDDSEGYTYHASDRTYSSLSSSQKFIWQGLYTWWGKESLNLITESYGSNFGFGSASSATVKDIHVGFYNSADNILAYVSNWSGSDGIAVDLDLMVNMYYYDDVDTSDPNGSTSVAGAGYLDRTLAHEFTHASMGANITNFVKLPLFIKEGMAEFTHGIDDERYYSIQSLAGNSSSLSNALSLSSSGSSGGNAYAGGYMFLHYLAKQISDSGGSDDFEFTEGDDYYENTTSGVMLNALGGKDTIDNDGASNVKIYGGKGNDSLISESYCTKVSISGDTGNDYIHFYSAVKNSSINGGAGNDYIRLYVSSKNNNKVYGGAGNDTIDGGGDGNTLVGGNGNDYIYVYSNDKNLKISGGAGKDSIYSGAQKASLSGGTGNDYLHLYTSATNTTINGGTGNDTIKSYASSSTTYVYKNGDGKDVIDGFNFGTDKIRLTSGSVKSKKTSGNDVILTIGKGSIRIKNGRGKKITVVNPSGKATNYTVGTAATNLTSDVAQLWFDEDSSSSNVYEQSLDKIAKTNSSVASSLDEIFSNASSLTSTSTGPITPTKYIVYADKNKIA